jgi:hypothetical protein
MSAYPSVETADALEAIELFVERGWTDGLPVIPPTEEAVARFLDVAGLDPDEVVLSIPTTHRRVTVRLAAINAVMAGCLPAYFPVILAALRGWADDRWGSGDPATFYASNTSTGGGAQLLIVNGPIRDALEINSGVNVYGPGRRANATIGRAMRLIQINAAGFVPGQVDNASQGHPGKFSFCIAENEEESPWEPLHVECGFGAHESTVTTVSARSPEPVENRMSNTADGILYTIADTMSRLGAMVNSVGGTVKVVVMGPEHANTIAGHGWTKQDVKRFLAENCRRSLSDLARVGMTEVPDEHTVTVDGVPYAMGCRGPEDVLLVVAGGYNAGVSSVITNWAYAPPRGEYIITRIATERG